MSKDNTRNDESTLDSVAMFPLAPEPDVVSRTDVGNAARLAKAHGDSVRWSPGRGWMEYDGTRWRPVSSVAVVRRALVVLRGLKMVAVDGGDSGLLDWVKKSQEIARVNAMVNLSRTYVEIADEAFDADPGLLNTTNGTIDLRTGQRHDHRPDDFLTRVTGCGLDAEIGCPTWEAFLDVVFDGDAELIGYVQRAVGMTLLGYSSEHVLFIMYGTGANGKTTFIETLHGVLGGYALKTPIDTFMKRRPGAATNDLARLAGVRMVSAVESDIDQRLAEGLVKSLTGSDTIAARLLYKEFFEFRPEFTPWIATNNLPSIQGTDYGIWRRVKVIPFSVTIPPHEQDHDLLRKLQAESPGILQWTVDGALAFQEQGLNEPKSITSIVDTYRRSQDPVGLWIDEVCDLTQGSWTSTADLVASFAQWREENGYEKTNSAVLTKRLSGLGLKAVKRRVGAKQVRGWAGITVGGSDDPDGSFDMFAQQG